MSRKIIFEQIIGKLQRTCDKYAVHFNELYKIQAQVEELNQGDNSDNEILEELLTFMNRAPKEDLAVRLVYLSFFSDVTSYKHNKELNFPEGDYFT